MSFCVSWGSYGSCHGITCGPVFVFYVCVILFYGQFPVVRSDQLHSLSCHSISRCNTANHQNVYYFWKKKKKIEWSVQYIEVNCHFFYIPLQVNGFPAENLLYPDRFYSKGMLFLVLGMRSALCGELCNNSSVKITFCVSVSLQAVFRSSKLI